MYDCKKIRVPKVVPTSLKVPQVAPSAYKMHKAPGTSMYAKVNLSRK